MPLVYLEPISPQLRKGELLALLDQVGGLDRQRVGRIELLPPRAVVEVPAGWEARLVRQLGGASLRGRALRVWTDAPGGDPADAAHFQHLAQLLELESKAQAEQLREAARHPAANPESGGQSLVDLVTTDHDTGLGGRHLVEFARRQRTPWGWTRLDTGSPVVVSPVDAAVPTVLRGVVLERTADRIWVAFGGPVDALDEHDRWRLDLAPDEIATSRARTALDRAACARGDRLAELREVLLARREPRFRVPESATTASGHSAHDTAAAGALNAVQQEAVAWALSAEDLALLHGPPGTGKTTTLAAFIAAAVGQGHKLLVCAPSNLAVDNLFERLLAAGLRALRLGHPARVLPALRSHSLDVRVAEHRDVRVARQLVKEAQALFRRAARTTRAKPAPGARSEARHEARALLADARRLEAQAVEQLLDQSDVLCATTTALDDELLGNRRFDWVVLDEACQSTEPGCWIPILRGDRLLLAGDHCQLPPTVVSPQAAAAGLGRSLFERLMEAHGPAASRRLSVQYRMHRAIMDFSSQEFYDAALAADPTVAGHTLAELSGVAADELTEKPLTFIDTAGAGYDEQPEPGGASRTNPQEARLIVRQVLALLERGLAPSQIAVITPYAAQVRHLRELLAAASRSAAASAGNISDVDVDSVDGFQGREQEAVLISLVRSNPAGEVGFLADTRRMNVALTRARRKLLVVGDSATLAHHPFYARLLEYFEAQQAYRTVWEEPEE